MTWDSLSHTHTHTHTHTRIRDHMDKCETGEVDEEEENQLSTITTTVEPKQNCVFV